tara:strand:- start:49 stop:1404 length:1356 start_codon:yes stop_codon:yes gene_type:complete
MASTYLSVSTTSSGTRTKWTTSFWVKRCSTGAEHTIFGSYLDSNNKDKIAFDSSDRLQFASVQAGGYSNGGNLVTNRVFRDTNAWYHIVLRWDTNNSTANDRMKIWVNGVEETSFSSRTNPTSGRESLINYTTYTKVGNNGSSGNYLNGVLSHIHFCDNYTYSASDFGSTDSTTGEWKINTSPSVSYGTNGFWWLKDSIATTDHSPNSNPFTVSGGTLTKTEDCPSNVFATWNPLAHNNGNYALTNGNTSYSNGDNNWSHGGLISTIGIMPSSGKYYWEHKKTYAGNHIIFGLISEDQVHRLYRDSGTDIYERINGVQLSNSSNSGIYLQEATDSGSIGSVANGGILQCAYDSDNQKLWYGINGTWHNSGDPANGTNETIGASEFTDGKIYFAFSQSHNSSGTASSDTNFGNGYFGTTAVSSAGTNASGIGIFEYDVPSGFTALSTKGLNE